MNTSSEILFVSAASIGFLHTVFGPDHYIPFVAMSRAKNWSLVKTNFVTLLCGLGHVLSSVLLGAIGVLFGVALNRLTIIESVRGEIAGWFLIAFGLIYFIWGIKTAYRKHHHPRTHVHHGEESNVTPWVLFTIFVFGPCEPLIPLLMYPAAQNTWWDVAWVTLTFGSFTLLTMLMLVTAMSIGLERFRFEGLSRFGNALAGLTLFLCGIAVQFLGL